MSKNRIATQRFKPGDEVILDTTICEGKPVKCRALVLNPLHPGLSGYYVQTLEKTEHLAKGHQIWVCAFEVKEPQTFVGITKEDAAMLRSVVLKKSKPGIPKF